MFRTYALMFSLVILRDAFAVCDVPGQASGWVLPAAIGVSEGAHCPYVERRFNLMAHWFPLFFVPAAGAALAYLALLSAACLHVALAIFSGIATTQLLANPGEGDELTESSMRPNLKLNLRLRRRCVS